MQGSDDLRQRELPVAQEVTETRSGRSQGNLGSQEGKVRGWMVEGSKGECRKSMGSVAEVEEVVRKQGGCWTSTGSMQR